MVSKRLAAAPVHKSVRQTGRHWIGKKGGAILREHKKDFGAIQYFLDIAGYEKAFLYVALK